MYKLIDLSKLCIVDRSPNDDHDEAEEDDEMIIILTDVMLGLGMGIDMGWLDDHVQENKRI